MNVLLIRTGGLGDCILTLPVAVRLREMHPDAELHVLGNGNMLAAARLTGLFAGFRSLDEAGFSALFAGGGTTPFLSAFFSGFDRVYCFSAGESGKLARTILDSGAGDCRVLDPRPPLGWSGHIAVHLLSILGADYPYLTPFPPLPHALSSSRDHTLLVIHPGSGGPLKNWPIERFIKVAEEWPGETRFLLGPAEMERGYAASIPGRFHSISDPTLAEAAALLVSAGAYLGNDSGASHLAALCGTPSVVLFGPTDPQVWRPMGENIGIVASMDGDMDGIGVEEVKKSITRVVSAGKGN